MKNDQWYYDEFGRDPTPIETVIRALVHHLTAAPLRRKWRYSETRDHLWVARRRARREIVDPVLCRTKGHKPEPLNAVLRLHVGSGAVPSITKRCERCGAQCGAWTRDEEGAVS